MHAFVICVIFLNFLCVQLFVIISDSIERLVKERSNSSSVSLDAQTLIMKTEYQARLWHFYILLCMVQTLFVSLSPCLLTQTRTQSLHSLEFTVTSALAVWCFFRVPLTSDRLSNHILTGHWPWALSLSLFSSSQMKSSLPDISPIII